MSATDLFPLESAFLLTELEVYNWGPFHGKHLAQIDRKGTAIIGPTGSGKTTLIDALMTLLAIQPKYNLASTGGHESDRDLISYVRGVSGVENATAENEHVARSGKTITGISARYYDGRASVIIGVILWTESSGDAAQDLKRLWFFSEDETHNLETFLTLHQNGGKRSLTLHEKENPSLRFFSSKKEYHARIRRFFEVGENAFSLLNRAAGLKQLNSIDQIFRELVLDDTSQFTRALEVASEFDNLAGIHAELESARHQRDSLIPVRTERAKLDKTQQQLSNFRELKSLHPHHFASLFIQYWEKEILRLTADLQKTSQSLTAAQQNETTKNQELNHLREQYLQLGGNSIQHLENGITETKKRADLIRPAAENYQAFVRKHDLNPSLDPATFSANQSTLRNLRETLTETRETLHGGALEAKSKVREAREKAKTKESEIHLVKARPESNIPPRFQEFRESLAAALNLKIRDLPFVAELIEVKPGEAAWRGAIERAIGSERLRLLVPEASMREALDFLNSKDHGIHVRLQEVFPDPEPACFFEDGFTRKLNFRNHPFRENLKSLLARRDRHCVASAEALRHTEHALTKEGTMSDRNGRFEKQDQRPLNEGWMTGFDNKDQLTALASQLLQIQEDIENLEPAAQQAERALTRLDQELQLLSNFETLTFEQINLPEIENTISRLEAGLLSLTTPDSDTAIAREKFKLAQRQFDLLRQEIQSLIEARTTVATKLEAAESERDQYRENHGEPLTSEQQNLCDGHFPQPPDPSLQTLRKEQQTTLSKLEKTIEEQEDKRTRIQENLIRHMAKAKELDSGALLDSGTEIRDIPYYIERLRILENEALPEKEKRFLEYLNKSSGQGVTQLLTNIESQVSIIEERIADLNRTLSLIDYRDGRYLQLDPQRTGHELLRSLDRARKKLIAAATRDDAGESHFRALREVISILRDAGENKDRLASRALLDPRHRLQFFVTEVSRETGSASGRRTGSQTGSGGEKEMMASYILTASLSYALCPAGASRPRYATIVLDEAFSKSSPAAAAKIIKALNRFGLHALFVTPNKEISLLKAHTRSAILVHNSGNQATLTSLTWEQIENFQNR